MGEGEAYDKAAESERKIAEEGTKKDGGAFSEYVGTNAKFSVARCVQSCSCLSSALVTRVSPAEGSPCSSAFSGYPRHAIRVILPMSVADGCARAPDIFPPSWVRD